MKAALVRLNADIAFNDPDTGILGNEPLGWLGSDHRYLIHIGDHMADKAANAEA